MLVNGKVWGTTELKQRTPLIEVHRLSILPLRQCSMHRHLVKWNDFYVLSGRLTIEVHKNDYDLVDVTELGPGDYTTVKPGDFHRFLTGAVGCECLEIYHIVPWTGEDIERRGVGGVVDPSESKSTLGDLGLE